MNTIGFEIGMHNFKTGEIDSRTDAFTTDEEALEYLPAWDRSISSAAVRNLYLVHRKMGKSIADAFVATLDVLIGEEKSDE